ncbi:ribosomal protein S36 [Kocuria palustris]|nr:ribosomal protein S36 [Kocuria palustris]
MRQAVRLLKQYSPSIKFVGGPHKFQSHPAGVHPCAPNGLAPSGAGLSGSSYSNSSPIEAGDGEVFSRAELPTRFQYKLPKEFEAEDIQSGGAEIVW